MRCLDSDSRSCLLAAVSQLSLDNCSNGSGQSNQRDSVINGACIGDLYRQSENGYELQRLNSLKEEEVRVEVEGAGWESVLVEEGLIAKDLTRLILLRRDMHREPMTWTLVEHYPHQQLERILEDHEEVLPIVRKHDSNNVSLSLRRVPDRYSELDEIAASTMWPGGVRRCVTCLGVLGTMPHAGDPTDTYSQLESIILEDEVSDLVLTPVFTRIWFRISGERWVQCYMLLVDYKLFMTSQIGQVGDMVRKWRRRTAGSSSTVSREYATLDEEDEDDDDEGTEKNPSTIKAKSSDGFSDIDLWSPNSNQGVLSGGDVRNYEVFTCLNSRRQLSSPTDFGLVLKPLSQSAAGLEPVVGSSQKNVKESGSLAAGAGGFNQRDDITIAALTAKDRLLWLTTMRLAKYGKQLRDNYRRFKSKQSTTTTSANQSLDEDFCGGNNSVMRVVGTESIRSRVAMDFTGPVGRLITDPKEAETVAVSESKRWPTRTLARNSYRHLARRGGSDVHLSQPWYHASLTRAQATVLIQRSTVDGVFLVRDSKSNQGAYVLTFKCANKVIHMPIHPMMDIVKEAVVYSLDSGVTKFYDILQLVEFYQLNAGCLPTRLGHYLSPTTSFVSKNQ